MKLVIFDLDGVLARTDHLHTFAFKEAIAYYAPEAAGASYLDARDGIRTKDKLARLKTDYQLSSEIIAKIDRRKQSLAEQHLRHIQPNPVIVACLQKLVDNGCTLALASNSRKSNVDIVINALGLAKFFSLKMTGDDVTHPKPHPEIFDNTIKHFNVTPKEVFILEDSFTGQLAAIASGAQVLEVDPNELITMTHIDRVLKLNK
jgi:beta-phosphoglucomutase